ncbi:MAG: tRNA (adenosine(37)-N6)-threonylcarbamoyltransferase complex dimerization subunit type 1 TsaB [Rhodospirillaceae bacterium]|nr:tRNA (adenosine(37)-N6)-threonylcarbamoyltransferase complex dimerization subunit type 1 TsaB [Rhodospirillaceae bacterium]
MTLVLGLDSATEACSAAVLRNGAVVARRFETLQRGHAEHLMPLVREVMTAAGISFAELDLIATTVGPGGFTGLRIGLASARGLAIAAKRPLVGVTTLEAVARAQPPREYPLLVALDTKRADFYLQLFDADGEPLSEPTALMPSEIASMVPDGPVVVAGNARDGAIAALTDPARVQVMSTGPALPDAAQVAAIGLERFMALPDAPRTPPSALYLRPPDARLPGAPSP